MIQLFEVLTEKYISGLKKLNKIFLVTQTYTGEKDHFMEQKDIILLVTDYEDKGLATVHHAAIKNDRYAAIIDLNNEKHFAKIRDMLSVHSPYLVYWAMVKDREQLKRRIDLKYKDAMRRYIMKNTKWRIGGDEAIIPKVQLIFGELFIILKHGPEELRIKFADLEKD